METNLESEVKLTPGTNELQAKMTKLEGKPDEVVLSRIRDAFSLADFDVRRAEMLHIQDEYYDTPDLLLHANNAAVRVRRSNANAKIVAKKCARAISGL